jgi:ParB-like chromosome segregation protein Spo0J
MQQLEHWPLSRLIEYARNPRKNDHAVDAVVAAIREFGFRVPILAKGDGTIIDGHLRFKAAVKLGLDAVPVLRGDDMTETQIKAFRLSVNRLAELAGWDNELLSLELAELEAAGFDLELTGFETGEIEALLAKAGDENDASAADTVDDVPDTPAQSVSRTGDIWLLGRHRLICGDAADASVIAALMDGEQASLCFTSPRCR